MPRLLFFSPGYPSEMPHFVRGLAEIGVEVHGLGDQPEAALPPEVRSCLSGYLRLPTLWDEEAVERAVVERYGRRGFDRVECLWEPGMLVAARVREAIGATGLGVEATRPFRDKERMKQALDRAGIRTPRHEAARDGRGIRAAAERIGYPLIVKPIAGAGSADTHRVEDPADLERAIAAIAHLAEVSVEEFVDGEEYTFDTISIEGRPAYYNVAWYRPRPLVARTNEWISPQVVALRHPDQAALAAGVAMGREVLTALGFERGFTHMEWFRTASGEAVFGEIAARPPGAHQVDQMNYSCDIDVYRGWAQAVCFGRFDEPARRLYNVANVYKRAEGEGVIRRVEGLDRFRARHREAIVWENLLPVGSRRRNWKQTLVSDGFVVVRAPDLETTLAIADEFGSEVRLYAA